VSEGVVVSKIKVAPILATARLDDIPYYDTKELLENFPGQKFIHDFTNYIHEADFKFFSGLTKDVVFCDIGGNIGQSINSLRLLQSQAQLHSFEINPICLPLLEKRGAQYSGPFKLHPYGLGFENGQLDLFVPVNGIHPVSTLGALSLDSLRTPHLTSVLQDLIPGPDWRVIRMRVNIKVFDDLGIRPDFVKIDVEGAEAVVLRGMVKTIESCRPIFLVENTNPIEVETFLAPFGYMPCHWDQPSDTVYVGHGKTGNSMYMHSTELVRRSRQPQNNAVKFAGDRNSLERRLEGLDGPVTDKDIVAACDLFFGIVPNAEQLAQHRAAHKSKLEMRNHFITYLLE
jgi:FkbM family methyltransferase